MMGWTFPLVREMRRRQNEGETLSDLAAELGCTPKALHAALDRHAPKPKPVRQIERGAPAYMAHVPGTRWASSHLHAVAVEWHAGRTLSDIAAEIGICKRSLRSALARAGVNAPGQVPSRTVKPRAELHKWQSQVSRAHIMRERGVMTWEQIAEAVGWPKTTNALRVAVSRYRARLGIDGHRGLSANGRTVLATAMRRRA